MDERVKDEEEPVVASTIHVPINVPEEINWPKEYIKIANKLADALGGKEQSEKYTIGQVGR
jgi:hypothetical protein